MLSRADVIVTHHTRSGQGLYLLWVSGCGRNRTYNLFLIRKAFYHWTTHPLKVQRDFITDYLERCEGLDRDISTNTTMTVRTRIGITNWNCSPIASPMSSGIEFVDKSLTIVVNTKVIVEMHNKSIRIKRRGNMARNNRISLSNCLYAFLNTGYGKIIIASWV